MSAFYTINKTVARFLISALIYSAGFIMLVFLLDISAPSAPQAVWLILPGIATIAFLFQIMDSAAGMGLGTAMAPLLIALGYSPLDIVPTLLIAQMFTGLLSGWMHRDIGNIEIDFFPPNRLGKASFWIIGTGMIATVSSVFLVYGAFALPDQIIETYVALLVILTGLFVLFHRQYIALKSFHMKRLIAFGILGAVNKGIGGGGYGPVLTLGAMVSGVREKSAVSLAVLSEGLVSIAGVITFFILLAGGLDISFVLLPSILIGTFLSAFSAPYLTRLCPPVLFQYLIPVYSIVIGLFVLGKIYFFPPV